MRGGKTWDQSRAQNSVEQGNKSEACRSKAHYGRGREMVRSKRCNSARKAECDLPSKVRQRKGKTPGPWLLAKSRSIRQARGTTVDFEMKQEAEPQGQAATPGKLARRNTPCRNGNKHEQRARHRLPVLGPGQASKPATGCKQWPASFSRFEYHSVGRKKLNRLWLIPVNFWLSRQRREFFSDTGPDPCQNPSCNWGSRI